MGYQANQNNSVIWNFPQSRWEAWATHTERGHFMFSWCKALPNGDPDPHWIETLWLYLLDETDAITEDHLRRAMIFIQADVATSQSAEGAA